MDLILKHLAGVAGVAWVGEVRYKNTEILVTEYQGRIIGPGDSMIMLTAHSSTLSSPVSQSCFIPFIVLCLEFSSFQAEGTMPSNKKVFAKLASQQTHEILEQVTDNYDELLVIISNGRVTSDSASTSGHGSAPAMVAHMSEK